MSASKDITLELLRDGPPHNQLISPLTAYLAAVQNRPPEIVRFAIEHRHFLRWQAGLTYSRAGVAPQAGKHAANLAERRHAIDDASTAVTRALGAIQALVSELAADPCDWRHVHLVVDATELAALPFELARAPAGVMVEGARLFLQQNFRVTLTRQTRRIATSVVSWPLRPRILCIVADGDLPANGHVLALRQHIDAWIGWDDAPTQEGTTDQNDEKFDPKEEELQARRQAEAEQILTVLDNPTIDEVKEVARSTCFTHVHILAHGMPLPDAVPGQTLYGVRFRGKDGKVDVVDPERLEGALRHPRCGCSYPTVVTLMTCAGGSMSGGILGPGGSAAHEIHSKGVPLVIASQFPLTKLGSVIATDMLYAGLLKGEDPRETVHAIRRALLVEQPDAHDWASLVMYGAFPRDLGAQLAARRRSYERIAAETSIERLRVTLMHIDSPTSLTQEVRDRCELDADRVERDVSRVRALTTETHPVEVRVRALRLVARFALRLWDAYVVRGNSLKERLNEPVAAILKKPSKHDFVTGQRPITALRPRELLKLAKDCYERAYLLDGSHCESWIAVIVLSWAWPSDWSADQQQALKKNLSRAHAIVDAQIERTERMPERADERELASALKFELELLDFLSEDGPPKYDGSGLPRVDDAFAHMLREVSPVAESYRAHCAYRQLLRYAIWVDDAESTSSTPSKVRSDAKATVKLYISKLRRERVRSYWGLRGAITGS